MLWFRCYRPVPHVDLPGYVLSADAMRFALADAGDTNDDANFEHGTANMAILRLTKELAWISHENVYFVNARSKSLS